MNVAFDTTLIFKRSRAVHGGELKGLFVNSTEYIRVSDCFSRARRYYRAYEKTKPHVYRTERRSIFET